MKVLGALFTVFFAFSSFAETQSTQVPHPDDAPNFMDSSEYDPFDPNINQILDAYDEYYEQETGESPHLDGYKNLLHNITTECYRETCAVWAHVVKSEQRLYLYFNGVLADTWLTSTGARGHGTPNFDRHPNGRIYNRYSSRKYPGGDYEGLGNMPYAVFIEGGFAIHGTPRGNWSRLGTAASHGCIRIHPDNAAVFNALVREAGIENTWITVE